MVVRGLKGGQDEPKGKPYCRLTPLSYPQPHSTIPSACEYAEKPNALLSIGSVLRERSR
jgi:hypothetical protein